VRIYGTDVMAAMRSEEEDVVTDDGVPTEGVSCVVRWWGFLSNK